MTGVTGIVLAGGQSTRMRRDKAFVKLGAATLVQHVVSRLRPLVDSLIIVGHAGNVERLRKLDLGAEAVLEDLQPGQGPLMGVYTGLMHANTPRCVFVPCDMPNVQPDLVDRLIAACGPVADVVASEVPGDGWHPFPLAVHARAGETVGALLDAGRRAMRDLVAGPRARLLLIDEPRLTRSFANFNTPMDVAGAGPDALAR